MSLSAIAQTNEQLAEKIKANNAYLYGEGFGNTHNEADQNAIANLISKIAINLNSSFNSVEQEVNNNGGLTSTSAVQLVVNSYAQASLTNTQSLVLKDAPNAQVLRYIAKSELNKIFAQRKDKVEDMIRSAQKSTAKLKIDDALRYYYWAFIMLKSLQYPNEVTYNDNGEQRKLMVWLPEQINAILEQLNVRVIEVNGNDATLYFTYAGQPVTSLDFTFYNGNSWTLLNSAKNGIAEIEVRPGVDIKSLKIRYEYEYSGETQIDSEIESVAKIFKGTYFRHSEVALAGDTKASTLKATVSKVAAKEQTANAKAVADIHIQPTTSANSKDYVSTISAIMDAVTKKNFAPIRSFFTDEGWDMMDKLLHYGRAKMLGKQNFSFYDSGNGRTVCRSLAMTFSFPNNNKTFTEDVTFTFNANGKIECVAFGLGTEAKTDIFNKGVGVWNDKSKMAIATFLENYKTAFALKRLDYIESIFDDNAVIIMGSVIKRVPAKTKNAKSSSQAQNTQTVRRSTSKEFTTGPILVSPEDKPHEETITTMVRYTKYSKDQYIKRLARTFAINQFVNIRFTDNDVVKMGQGGEVYGIQIHQDYYSSRYGDTGYLFLLVDINDPDNPIITVRTWQPERDPNINGRLPRNHPDYGIIGPGNF